MWCLLSYTLALSSSECYIDGVFFFWDILDGRFGRNALLDVLCYFLQMLHFYPKCYKMSHFSPMGGFGGFASS
jgi:hypothetical protein